MGVGCRVQRTLHRRSRRGRSARRRAEPDAAAQGRGRRRVLQLLTGGASRVLGCGKRLLLSFNVDEDPKLGRVRWRAVVQPRADSRHREKAPEDEEVPRPEWSIDVATAVLPIRGLDAGEHDGQERAQSRLLVLRQSAEVCAASFIETSEIGILSHEQEELVLSAGGGLVCGTLKRARVSSNLVSQVRQRGDDARRAQGLGHRTNCVPVHPVSLRRPTDRRSAAVRRESPAVPRRPRPQSRAARLPRAAFSGLRGSQAAGGQAATP